MRLLDLDFLLIVAALALAISTAEDEIEDGRDLAFSYGKKNTGSYYRQGMMGGSLPFLEQVSRETFPPIFVHRI